jgi:localization factor PodJL
MKPGVPWSVKGIEPDAREAAKTAARRSGMTLGEWLNSRILAAADSIPDTTPERDFVRSRPMAAQAAMPSQALERTANRLEDIAEQLSRLSRRDAETAPRASAPVAGEQDALHRILSRVDSNERQTVEAFTAVNERLSVLGRQMAQAARPRETKVEDHPGFVGLEKAVRNIVEHMETSEKRTRDNFKSLHDRMAALTQKASAAPQDAVSKQAPAFSQLEARLADLAKRVERSENAPAAASVSDLLKTELTELADRIDTVRDTAEQLATRAQTQAVQASQKELRAIESRIVGLIKEAQASITSQGAAPADMQRLRGEVERLNARIDEASRGQAQGGDVMALRAAVEQLSTRVAQGPDPRPLQELDRRLLDVAQRLEHTQAQTRNLPQVSELERRMAELDHKLNEAMTGRASGPADEIEERLNEIATRVGRTEQQLGSLETIERAVNQLFDSLEQQRTWTQGVAEDAAARMAQQVLAQVPQPASLTGSPELQALQDGLTAVRTAAEGADTRNQETLEAVHETLEQIVNKLAELETAAIGQRVAAAVGPGPATHSAMPAASVLQPSVMEANPLEMPTADPFQVQPAAAGFQAFDAAPVAEGNPFAAQPVMPELPPFNPFDKAMPQGESGEAGVPSDDFIAAARRAAQSAVQPKSVLNGISPGAARVSEATSKKLLNLSFLKPKKAKAAAPAAALDGGELRHPPGFKPANSNDSKKRKYIIMGIALLAAVSVFTFNMLGQTKKAKAPAKPAVIEEQLAPKVDPAASGVIAPAAPAATPDAPAADAPVKAAPPKPKPAELESMLLPEGADPVLTGSLEQADTRSIASLVAGTDDTANALPAEEAGPQKLREAASLGNADAQFVVATRYLNGEGTSPQDFGKAAYWYGKAAAAGNAPAQYRLGTLYERGSGVAKDLATAQKWYERSAALGNVKAMHNAAVLAAGSSEQKADYGRAFKWFSLGAAHGLRDSQFNLAVLLERGLGTKANPTEAYFWYRVAANMDDPEAKKRADALGKKLTAAEKSATEARLTAWTAEKAPETANTVAVRDAGWQTDING